MSLIPSVDKRNPFSSTQMSNKGKWGGGPNNGRDRFMKTMMGFHN